MIIFIIDIITTMISMKMVMIVIIMMIIIIIKMINIIIMITIILLLSKSMLIRLLKDALVIPVKIYRPTLNVNIPIYLFKGISTQQNLKL